MKFSLRYFAIIYIPIALVLLVTLYLTHSYITKSAQKELLGEMKHKWEMLNEFTGEGTGNGQYHEEIRAVSSKTGLRVTLIAPSGVVIDDSYMKKADIPTMDNHRNRPEVKDAIYKGEGYSLRLSATVGQKMFYYARKTRQNILRIAYPFTYVNSLTKGFTRHIISLSLLLFFTIGLISAYLASRISIPVKRLNEITDRIEERKHHVHFPRFKDPTMGRISDLIYRLYSLMRKEQKRLLQERERLDLILSVLDEAIIFLDGQNRVLLHNNRADDYLGVSLKKNENIYDTVDDPRALTFVNEILVPDTSSPGKRYFRGRTFEAYCRTLTAGKLIVFSDITEKTLYASFKTELVGNISHELKTPLSMIMGYAETVLNDPAMKREVLERFLETIFSSSKRLNNLIDDVLELHRLESIEKDFFIAEPTELTEVVQAVSGLYDRGVKKRVTIQSCAGQVHILFEHISSILTNLIDNALHYSSGKRVEASVERKGKGLLITVSDEGPPVPEEERQRIFERFYTISKSRARAKSGTGLGLAIVKHITHLYDGSVTLEENDSGGNTFTVVLYERSDISGLGQ